MTFDDSGDMQIEVHDEGSMTFDGETTTYSSDIEGELDLGAEEVAEGGGILDALGDIF